MNSDDGALFLDPETAHPADLRVARRLDDLRKRQAARVREIKAEMMGGGERRVNARGKTF